MTRWCTLVLTDLVSSTRLAEELGDRRMAELSAAHDRLARRLLREHSGREIDRTDGFLLIFAETSDAVAFAVAYHRGLAELGLKARVGIHAGSVLLVEAPPEEVAHGAKPLEVEGVAKPIAARIMATAIGGQTLISTTASAALGDTRWHLAPRGWWKLRGLADPIELLEVGDDRAPFAPPPDTDKGYRVTREGEFWLPVREVRRHLPAERDGFVGRVEELAALDRAFDGGARLVTLLGVGGTGKTRLATRFAWLRLGDFPGGVWFCDLTEARSAQGIEFAVARTLDVPLGRGNATEQIGHAIAGRGACLIVLDNFEQVSAFGRQTVGPWLDRAEQARFVVTSRERLGIPGETALQLAPLGGSDGEALFVARARQARPDFTPAPEDREAIARLIALLDGLPLAIELAAARSGMLAPADLLERMGERFDLLSARGRTARHATLRAALDWSWNLLSPDEQSALAQLAVFEGGFTLEAAEGVLALDEALPMEALQALVDKSLVRMRPGTGGSAVGRLDLLVSIAEYASEKLVDREGAERRHGAFFARYGTLEAIDRLDRHGGVARRQALARELDNLVVACRRAIERRDGPVALATLQAACEVLELQGSFSTCQELAAAVVALLPPGPDRARARVRVATAYQMLEQQDEGRAAFHAVIEDAGDNGVLADRAREGLARLDFSRMLWEAPESDEVLKLLERARARGDRAAEGRVLSLLALIYEKAQSPEAIRTFELGIARLREVGNRRIEGATVSNLGMHYQDLDRLDLAEPLLREGLAIHLEVGNRRSQGNVLAALAVLTRARGDLVGAEAMHRQAIALHADVGHRSAQGNALCNLAFTLIALRREDEARPLLDEGLAIHHEVGNLYSVCVVHQNLADQDLHEGRLDAARAHVEAGLAAARAGAGDRRSEALILGAAATLATLEGRNDDARSYLEAQLATALAYGDVPGEVMARSRLDRYQPMTEADITLAERALRPQPQRLAAFFGNLAEAAAHRGDLDGARGWFDRALAAAPAQELTLRQMLEKARTALPGARRP